MSRGSVVHTCGLHGFAEVKKRLLGNAGYCNLIYYTCSARTIDSWCTRVVAAWMMAEYVSGEGSHLQGLGVHLLNLQQDNAGY